MNDSALAPEITLYPSSYADNELSRSVQSESRNSSNLIVVTSAYLRSSINARFATLPHRINRVRIYPLSAVTGTTHLRFQPLSASHRQDHQ
jgi:hypothetical protein